MEEGPSLSAAPSYAGVWTKLVGKGRQGGRLLEPWLETHIVSTLGFAQMTPVQASTIPQFLSHRDVIVEAVTGSGKTLAYVIPTLQMLIRRCESRSAVDEEIEGDNDGEIVRTRKRSYRKGQVGALVICPTRELAQQVYGVVSDFLALQPGAKPVGEGEDGEGQEESGEAEEEPMISGALLAIGGTKSSPAHDYKRFKDEGADIIIGTPGRVQELLERPGVDVKELEVLVLDEADRLLDLGFAPQVTSILRMLPKQRRTGLFSATMTDGLTELARVGLRNPVRVVVKVESRNIASSSSSNDKRMPASLQNFYLVSRTQDKLAQLLRLLTREASTSNGGQPGMRKAIVYFATCAQVNYFYKILTRLQEEGLDSCPLPSSLRLYSLHGKQTPARRTATFEAFVNANPVGSSSSSSFPPGSSQEAASILFCTDVAARGLDLPDVDLVVQFDAPTDPKSFSHRCGRTARAGRHGKAVVLLSAGREEEYVAFLKVRKCPVRFHPALLEDGQAAGAISGGKEEGQEETPLGEDEGATRLTQSMQGAIRADRDLYDWSMRAFVSFVRSYGKHEASFIFRPQDLDLAALSRAFGLLRLPRMPETRGLTDGQEEVDLSTLAYKDEKREKQRLESLQREQKEAEERGKGQELTRKKKMRGAKASEEAWSDQKKRKERKEERKEKKIKRRKAIRAAAIAQPTESGEEANEKAVAEGQEEEDDWIAEERETKRQKKQAEGHFSNVDFEGL